MTAPDGRVWAHCSPALLGAGVDCATADRKPCECPPALRGSHDHTVTAEELRLALIWQQGRSRDLAAENGDLTRAINDARADGVAEGRRQVVDEYARAEIDDAERTEREQP